MYIAYDSDGFFAGDYPDAPPDNGMAYTDKPCPPGFIMPKFDGEKWIEGGTAGLVFVPEEFVPEETEMEV